MNGSSRSLCTFAWTAPAATVHAPGFRLARPPSSASATPASYLFRRALSHDRVPRGGAYLRDAARRMFQIDSRKGPGALIRSRPDDRRHHRRHRRPHDPLDVTGGWRPPQRARPRGDAPQGGKGEVLGRPPNGYKVGNRRRPGTDPRRSGRRPLHLPALPAREWGSASSPGGSTRRPKTRRGGNWSMVSIRDILRNRVYLGTYSASACGCRAVTASSPPMTSTRCRIA